MGKIKRYFQGVIEQGKMVRWPTRKDLLASVTVVLIVMVVSAVALSLSDLLVSQLLKMLDGQFSSGSSNATDAAIRLISRLF